MVCWVICSPSQPTITKIAYTNSIANLVFYSHNHVRIEKSPLRSHRWNHRHSCAILNIPVSNHRTESFFCSASSRLEPCTPPWYMRLTLYQCINMRWPKNYLLHKIQKLEGTLSAVHVDEFRTKVKLTEDEIHAPLCLSTLGKL